MSDDVLDGPDTPTKEGCWLRTSWGEWRQVVSVTSGKMPTPIDPSVSVGLGQSLETCALWGGKRHEYGKKRGRGKNGAE